MCERRDRLGSRQLVAVGIRMPDNPLLVRQIVFKTTTKTGVAECPALVAEDYS